VLTVMRQILVMRAFFGPAAGFEGAISIDEAFHAGIMA
jgi:hypothetical protein